MRRKILFFFIILSIFLTSVMSAVAVEEKITTTVGGLYEALTRLYSHLEAAGAVSQNIEEQKRLVENELQHRIGKKKMQDILSSIDDHLDSWGQGRAYDFIARNTEEITYLQGEYKNLGLTEAERNLFIQKTEANRYIQKLSGIIGEFQTNIRAINDFTLTLPPHPSDAMQVQIIKSAVDIPEVPPRPGSLSGSYAFFSPPPTTFEKVPREYLLGAQDTLQGISDIAEARIAEARRALSQTYRELTDFINDENLSGVMEEYYRRYNEFILRPSRPLPTKNQNLNFISEVFKKIDSLKNLSQSTKEFLKTSLKDEIKIQAFIDETARMRQNINQVINITNMALRQGGNALEISIPTESMKTVRHMQTIDNLPRLPQVLRDFAERITVERIPLDQLGRRFSGLTSTNTGRPVVPQPSTELAEEGMQTLRNLAAGEVQLNPDIMAKGFAAENARMARFTHLDPALARQPFPVTPVKSYKPSPIDTAIVGKPAGKLTVVGRGITTLLGKTWSFIAHPAVDKGSLPLQMFQMYYNQPQKARAQYDAMDHELMLIICLDLPLLHEQETLYKKLFQGTGDSKSLVDIQRAIEQLRKREEELKGAMSDWEGVYRKTYGDTIKSGLLRESADCKNAIALPPSFNTF